MEPLNGTSCKSIPGLKVVFKFGSSLQLFYSNDCYHITFLVFFFSVSSENTH